MFVLKQKLGAHIDIETGLLLSVLLIQITFKIHSNKSNVLKLKYLV